MEECNQIAGVIYPVASQYVNAILKGKDIFVKSIPRSSRKPNTEPMVRIQKGHRLLLYQSKSANRIAGEAKISKIEFLSVEKIITNYESRLCIPGRDLIKSVQTKRNNKLLVLTLENIRKYEGHLFLDWLIPPSGIYFGYKLYERLMGKLERDPHSFLGVK